MSARRLLLGWNRIRGWVLRFSGRGPVGLAIEKFAQTLDSIGHLFEIRLSHGFSNAWQRLQREIPQGCVVYMGFRRTQSSLETDEVRQADVFGLLLGSQRR